MASKAEEARQRLLEALTAKSEFLKQRIGTLGTDHGQPVQLKLLNMVPVDRRGVKNQWLLTLEHTTQWGGRIKFTLTTPKRKGAAERFLGRLQPAPIVT